MLNTIFIIYAVLSITIIYKAINTRPNLRRFDFLVWELWFIRLTIISFNAHNVKIALLYYICSIFNIIAELRGNDSYMSRKEP
jgi:hypothetical protein